MTTVDPQELLPEIDREFLKGKEYAFSVEQVGGPLHLTIRNFELSAAYTPSVADSLLIILPAGYPNSNPDMFWTIPDVKLTNGNWPAQSNHHETYGDRVWQRWSRHLQRAWRPGIDNLRTYLATIRQELARGI